MKKVKLLLISLTCNLAPFVRADVSTADTEVTLPLRFDVRQSVRHFNAIKNQQECGNSVAFAMTAAMEIGLTYRFHKEVVLSENFISTCDTENFPSPCSAANPSFDFAVSPGLVREKDFPVRSGAELCHTNLPIAHRARSWAFLKTSSQSEIVAEEDIKAAILKHGSVSSFVYVSCGLADYRGGVFENCQAGAKPNHMVTIIGWDDEGGYWIARNSWGEDWGEKGYLRIKYGCNGIGTGAAFIDLGNQQ